ncbi:hypothetical protein [Paenibacillus monticola]|uniref:Uncharacterized protein n=1 Tax=Paenibacillus monticola TaxID=2666075 RepID=A0A7X2H820_9BACL|nr:hypothetical protein [Paenibacillus monticola]MRN55256.1 hypothetical protein [Paenibacillus monticola]
MKKKFMLSCLIAVMSLAVAVPMGFTQEAPATVNTNAVTQISIAVDKDLTANNGSDIAEFHPNSAMGYYKIWVPNYSTVRLNALLTDMNSVYQGEYVIQPGTSSFFRNSSKATAESRFSVTSGDGSKLNGHINIKIAVTASELQ